MKVALVGPEIEENLALRYLAGSLRAAGHSTEVFAFNRAADVPVLARNIREASPGLVGFSLVAQRRFEDFRRLAETLRAQGYRGHITAGGHFASLRASEILRDTPQLDSILHHDGEERICALARALDDGVAGEPVASRASSPASQPASSPAAPWDEEPPPELDGMTWRALDGGILHRPPVRVPDVDALPLPWRRRADRTLGFARAPMVTSRGCAGACSFCSIHAWHRQVASSRLRFRSPRQVAEEMVSLYREEGVRVFVFHDDDFIHPKASEALRRCREILDRAESGIGRPFGFVIKCRPDDVNEELFTYLKSMGLVRAYVGIESSSALGVRTLNRRTTPEQNERALDVLRRTGVFGCFNLLLFHPETSLEELEENLGFLERHLEFPFDVARTELYARSGLEDRLLREGRAVGDYRGYDYRMADARAETVFQLFARILWDRHFGGDSILHRSQELGYRASLLDRLLPEAVSPELKRRVRGLIREVNGDTTRYLRRIKEAVEAGRPLPLEEMNSEVAVGLRKRSAQWAALSLELEWRAAAGRSPVWRASRTMRPLLTQWPRMAGRLAAAAPMAASFLGLLSCGNETSVCDPPPPPFQYATDLAPRLDEVCAVPECHAGATPQAGLDLTAERSYANLVDVRSTQVPRMDRVETADTLAHNLLADSSYVVHKLQGTQAQVGGTGERMPKGRPPEPDLTDAVKSWIGLRSPE